MNRHFEYIDADGKLNAATINVHTLERENASAMINKTNELIANLARVKGWQPFPGETAGGKPVYVHAWHPSFAPSEQMKRINHVQNVNGQKLLYTDQQIADADKPGTDITIAQFDRDGNAIPSMVVPPFAQSQMTVPNLIAPNAAQLTGQTIAVQQMGTTAAIPSAPVASSGPVAAATTG